jgi:Lon protease-like protein
LRGCILLPRAGLPLNIFEPRYLAMFDDALAGNRLLAIVQPARTPIAANDDHDDAADAESPLQRDVALRSVAGVGRIMAFQELEDGRLIVSLTGVTRCRLAEELPSTKPYRTFRIEPAAFAADLMAGKGEQDVPREQLLTALKRFLEARNLKADWASISRSGNEQLVNSLSVMSPYGPEEKQALLEADTLKARAEMLIALAEMELAARGGSSGSTLQ